MSIIDKARKTAVDMGRVARTAGKIRKIPRHIRHPDFREAWLEGWDEIDADFIEAQGYGLERPETGWS